MDQQFLEGKDAISAHMYIYAQYMYTAKVQYLFWQLLVQQFPKFVCQIYELIVMKKKYTG